MTYAIWAIQNSFQKEGTFSDSLKEVIEGLFKAKEKTYKFFLGKKNIFSNVIAVMRSSYNYEKEDYFWFKYFKNLNYNFDKEELEGLKRFYEDAFEVGILKEKVSFSFF